MDRELKTHLLWAFYVPSTLVAIAWGLLIPVLPVFGRDLTPSYLLLGLLLAGDAIGKLLFDLPAGAMLRKLGTRHTMQRGLLMTLAGMALMPLANNIALATGLLVLAGAGLSIYSVSRHAYITQVTNAHVRGRAIALFGGVYRFGKFVGPVIGGWTAAVFGVRAVFGVFILFTLATLYFVWRYMGDAKVDAAPAHPHERLRLRWTVQQHSGVLFRAGVGQILAQLTRLGWLWAIPLYAATVLELDVAVIGVVVGVGAAFDALLFYSAGLIMDRFGRKWAIVPSFALQALGTALIPFAGGAWALAGASILIGAANAISSGTMMTVGGDLSPTEARGEFLAVWRFIGDVGFMGGPLVVGGVAQVLALQTAIFTVAGVGLGTAVWFALLVPETLRRAQVVRRPQINAFPIGDNEPL